MKKRRFTTITVKRGKQTFKKSVAYHTLSELAEKKAAFEQECDKQSKHIFADVADQWQEEHNKTIEYYTAQSYIPPLNDLKAAFGELELNEISALMFQQFLKQMQTQGFARQTINLRKVTMSQIFDYAVLHNMIVYNPIKVCKVPKAPKATRLPPTDEEIEKIKAAPDSFWKRYFMLLMFSGLRREEALALTKADLDFQNCTVNVNKTLVFENNVPVVRDRTKSEAGTRLAPFPAILHPLFQNVKSGLIFARDGKPINKGQFDKGIAKFKRETGITCNSHQLRHYFATLCHDVIPPKDAQHLLGHASYHITEDTYTHIDKIKKQAAIKRLNEYIEKAN